MENQHRQITGYRDFTQEEIDQINVIKQAGNTLETMITYMQTSDTLKVDQRWLSIAKTHLQQGLMALTRSVAKPTSF